MHERLVVNLDINLSPLFRCFLVMIQSAKWRANKIFVIGDWKDDDEKEIELLSSQLLIWSLDGVSVGAPQAILEPYMLMNKIASLARRENEVLIVSVWRCDVGRCDWSQSCQSLGSGGSLRFSPCCTHQAQSFLMRQQSSPGFFALRPKMQKMRVPVLIMHWGTKERWHYSVIFPHVAPSPLSSYIQYILPRVPIFDIFAHQRVREKKKHNLQKSLPASPCLRASSHFLDTLDSTRQNWRAFLSFFPVDRSRVLKKDE